MDEERKNILGLVTIPQDIIEDVKNHVQNIVDFGKKIQENTAGDTTHLLDTILLSAINLEASDIHIEPQSNQIRLRLRLDGVLQDVVLFEEETYHHLLSRLKLLSKLKLNVTEKPQDGRFTIAIDEMLIEIRTSSLPTEYGESIVMRILNPKNLIGLQELGLRQDLYDIIDKELKKPNGMIAVSGPTGSGKTTTLYAFLMKIYNPEIKIITIEDPIEYHLKGVQQTQISEEKGYTFAEGLSSIIRQDPDVILVGEIRDSETAKIALQASLTGHLVLSTIHTNDVAGAIPRFMDLGASTLSITPAINMIVGERLVRKICQKCGLLETPTSAELAEIKKGLEHLNPTVLLPKNLDEIKIPRIKTGGCVACNFTGYKGRQGIFEIFLMDAEMEKFILTNPAVSSIKELLVKKGMTTIYQSGLIEVVLGKTTLEEVKKVVEED
jgi:type II secretory ATPase GspE/PulE/Tfp pilus assembly ATPase PilB-like protein